MSDQLGNAEAIRRTWLTKFGRSPVYAAFVSLFAVLTGFIGSLFAPEIRSAFPFYWGRGTFVPSAALFWGFLTITGVMYWWRQVVVDCERRDAEEALLGQSNKLEELIRTLPPADFLAAFEENYLRCSSVIFELLVGHEEDREAATIESALQMILVAVAGLARHYDGTPKGIVYASNIMTSIPIAEIPDPVPQNLEDAARFFGGTIEEKRGELESVLLLQVNYSAVVPGRNRDGDTPDRSLVPLLLPIPKTEKTGGGLWRVLPGAPLAFCVRRPNGYEDTATMAAFCERRVISRPAWLKSSGAISRNDTRRESRAWSHCRSCVPETMSVWEC